MNECALKLLALQVVLNVFFIEIEHRPFKEEKQLRCFYVRFRFVLSQRIFVFFKT